MQVINVKQGSEEWHELRCGLISASRFKDIMTEPRAKKDKDLGLMSATAKSYLYELCAEIVTGQIKDIKAPALDWGNDHEQSALDEYADWYDIDTGSTGIIINDEGTIGGSPDALCAEFSDGGMGEVKCPFNTTNHIRNVSEGMDKDHLPQVQGNMMINGRKWCDFISFDPRITGKGRLYVQRIERDEDYISELTIKINKFLIELKRVLREEFDIDWKGVDVEAIKTKHNLGD